MPRTKSPWAMSPTRKAQQMNSVNKSVTSLLQKPKSKQESGSYTRQKTPLNKPSQEYSDFLEGESQLETDRSKSPIQPQSATSRNSKVPALNFGKFPYYSQHNIKAKSPSQFLTGNQRSYTPRLVTVDLQNKHS